MKAVIHRKYGPPKGLGLEDTEKPSPKDDEVLVRVHAASANAADLDHLRGTLMVRPGGAVPPAIQDTRFRHSRDG